MNPKQCKRIRKQLSYKKVYGELTEEQKKLKKQYKTFKKMYTSPKYVVHQEPLPPVVSSELLEERSQRKSKRAMKRADRIMSENDLIVAGAERRQKHIETQMALEKSAKTIKKEVRQIQFLAEQEKYRIKEEKRLVTAKNIEERKKKNTELRELKKNKKVQTV